MHTKISFTTEGGKVLEGTAFTLSDIKELTAGKRKPMIIVNHGGPPIVMEDGDLDKIIPRHGKLVRLCGGCMRMPADDETFKTCGRCKRTNYCSLECQRSHWKSHKAMCSLRLEWMDDLCKKEKAAAEQGTLFYNQLTLEKWYRNLYSHIVEYAAFHVLEVYKGPAKSMQRTHAAFFMVAISEEDPNDPDKVTFWDVSALPLSKLQSTGSTGAWDLIQAGILRGMMGIIIFDSVHKVLHFENHSPGDVEPYLHGEKQPEPQWRLYTKLAFSMKHADT